ncbi:MAG: hypothetical protein NT023_25815 [Armatimonadetes bacterium]|nr:hypothetical protein [Armatimonadota bacterium]
MRNGQRSTALLVSSLFLLMSLLSLVGCGGKKEEKSATSGSGGYYEGPMKPKATTTQSGKGGDGP